MRGKLGTSRYMCDVNWLLSYLHHVTAFGR